MNGNDKIVDRFLLSIKIAIFIVVAVYLAGWNIYYTYQSVPSYNPANEPKIEDVHRLVKHSHDPFVYVKLHSLLDLLWEDEQGKKLLAAMVRYQVPIVITNFESSGGGILRLEKAAINNAFNPKRGFNNDMYSFNQMECMMVLIHEICHCITGFNANVRKAGRDNRNSMEEEMGASILGINIASRIIQNKNLSEKEIEEYCQKYAKWINGGLRHGYLTPTNGFCDNMKDWYDIEIPNSYRIKNYYKNYYMS